MATATGLTAVRMLEIEAQSVTDGEVIDDNLFLIRHDGSVIDAGNVRGPEGTIPEPLEKSFVTGSNDWEFEHNLDTTALNVRTENSSGEELRGTITHPDSNTVNVHFYHPQTGTMSVAPI